MSFKSDRIECRKFNHQNPGREKFTECILKYIIVCGPTWRNYDVSSESPADIAGTKMIFCGDPSMTHYKMRYELESPSEDLSVT